NLANAHASIGNAKIYIGRAEETEAHVLEALRLSPRDTLAFVWMGMAGLAKNRLGSWEQAVAWYRRAIEANRNYPLAELPQFVCVRFFLSDFALAAAAERGRIGAF